MKYFGQFEVASSEGSHTYNDSVVGLFWDIFEVIAGEVVCLGEFGHHIDLQRIAMQVLDFDLPGFGDSVLLEQSLEVCEVNTQNSIQLATMVRITTWADV